MAHSFSTFFGLSEASLCILSNFVIQNSHGTFEIPQFFDFLRIFFSLANFLIQNAHNVFVIPCYLNCLELLCALLANLEIQNSHSAFIIPHYLDCQEIF